MKINKWVFRLLLGILMLLLSSCSALPSTEAKGDARDEGQAGDESAGSDGDGSQADGGKEEEWGLDLSTPDESVNYGIYIGANVTGTCGPYKNSGGFKFMTFDSVFHNIVFVRPGSKKALTPYGGIYRAGGEGNFPRVGIGLNGEGKMGDFTFCPEYNGDKECACHVTNGPNPFEPILSLLPEEDPGIYPLVGTPEPNNLGYAVLHYSIGGTKDLGPIMEWEGCIGIGALGGDLQPIDIEFLISWDKLMAGEEFADSVTGADEGEKWEWSIRFMPGY